jgi:hypothetical protein
MRGRHETGDVSGGTIAAGEFGQIPRVGSARGGIKTTRRPQK